MESQISGVWVFGYGSLCWNPGFEYKKSVTGHVKGFSRRFWQGNCTHRGTIHKPGRVATLITDKEEITFGRAFEISGSAAIPYLKQRECKLGGYVTTISTFYSRDGNQQFPVVIYIANDESDNWLGDAPLHTIAQQILESSGPSGHNAEYLLRLADFMHQHIPEAHDEHLFTLETMVRSMIKKHNMCLQSIMGNREFITELDVNSDSDNSEQIQTNNVVDVPISLNFLWRVPSKPLRCIKL